MNTPLSTSASPTPRVDRDDLLQRWRDGRAFTRVLFDRLLPEDAWLEQPDPGPPSLRLLRGPSRRVRREHARQGRARPARRGSRCSSASSSAGSTRRTRATGRALAWPTRERVADYVRRADSGRRGRDRDDRPATPRETRSPSGTRPCSRDRRARAHASGDAPLHAARAARRARSAGRRISSRSGSGERRRSPARVAIPAGARRSARTASRATFGWDNEFPRTRERRPRLRDRRLSPSRTRTFWSS